MPDTFFTAAPRWEWLIILYFFIGGIAGGAYFIAAMIDLVGRPADRPIARLGYYVALPLIALSGILLTADLGRPERFWHMLVQSSTGAPMFKSWSPMSVGSWGIFLFGIFAFLSFLGALAEEGYSRFAPLRGLRHGVLGGIISVLGGLFGFFVASYTGVLLSVTNRPIWADTSLLGLVFLLSGASTAAATLILLGRERVAPPDAVRRLARLDTWVMLLELLALVALVASLGAVARVWLSAWGALLVVGVVLVGILLPLALHWRPRVLGAMSAPTAAALVLAGGFLLRVVVVLSSEGV